MMKMTKKDIKYVLLFQNKLSSKPGSHMPVSAMSGNSPPPHGRCGYLGGMLWIQNSISAPPPPPFVAFTITKRLSAFIEFTVVIYVSLNIVILLKFCYMVRIRLQLGLFVYHLSL